MADNETDFDDIAEALEEAEQYEEQMAEAYRKWEEEGDRSMLEDLTQQLHSKHAWDVKDKLEKKGRNLDYDKSDAGHVGALITGLAILIHPLALTLWAYIGHKVFQHSRRKINGEDSFWQRLDQFGFELFYYLTYSAIVAYLLIGLQGHEVVLSNAGTAAQILVEVMQFAGL